MESDRLSKKREVTECLSSVMDVLEQIADWNHFVFALVGVDVVRDRHQTNIMLREKILRPPTNLNVITSKTGKIFLCQVGTKKILRIYKPFIGGQPPVNGLRFLYALVPFFVRRFLYAAANASNIGVTGSSLSGLDRYSNRMPFSRNFRSNLMKEEVSRLIREVSRVRIVPMS